MAEAVIRAEGDRHRGADAAGLTSMLSAATLAQAQWLIDAADQAIASAEA